MSPNSFDHELKSGDRVMIELDLRESTPEKRTMHLFINDNQVKLYGYKIPQSPQFGVDISNQNDQIRFEGYCIRFEPAHKSISSEQSVAPRE